MSTADPAPPPPPKKDDPKIGAIRTAILKAEASMRFEGPLPPPALLAKYDEIHPGLANRLVCMAESEAQHRHEMEKTVLNADIAENKRERSEARCGQLCGLVITLAGLAVGLHGDEWT